MNKQAFTPGPWRHGLNGDMTKVTAWSRAGAQTIAHCYVEYTPSGADRPNGCNQSIAGATANAKLIAAAPELYEALLEMVAKATKQNWNDAYPDQLAQAQAALAKAVTP